jgi:hypothetical protein
VNVSQTSSMHLDHALEAKRNAYKTAADLVVRDLIPGAGASVEIIRTEGWDRPVFLVTVPMPRFALRVSVEDPGALEPLREGFAEQLGNRVAEAIGNADRFAARCADVHAKAEASLLRNGGMKLMSLEMSPYDVREPFEWYDSRLDARIQYVGVMLRPEVEVISAFTAREMAGTFRWLGKEHQRRLRTIARLAAVGAVCEIDVVAEHEIVTCGLTVGEVAAELLNKRTVKIPTDMGGGELSIMDGRIFLVTMFSYRTARRPIAEKEIAQGSSVPTV